MVKKTYFGKRKRKRKQKQPGTETETEMQPEEVIPEGIAVLVQLPSTFLPIMCLCLCARVCVCVFVLVSCCKAVGIRVDCCS